MGEFHRNLAGMLEIIKIIKIIKMDIANLLRSSSPLSSPPLSPLPPPPSPLPPSPPVELSTPTRAEITHDQRIEARTLHRVEWKF
ncbi:hypothetical protein DSL72_008551 [Monilinia vaccinii-corymbosi]|uniref:Uncharacterized protein n=1 Tax=Monilinia vaccinii-corymbosi TaxID=61207 RepID=A0A8A3PRG1_9HELO|nr:hypothetical protein DSL72_008551 [Monilinia vaccinii-corymbosi]